MLAAVAAMVLGGLPRVGGRRHRPPGRPGPDHGGRPGDGSRRRPRIATAPARGAASGGSGVGDALYPDLGNGGYDVDHYDLVLAPDAGTGVLTATATITATAVDTADGLPPRPGRHDRRRRERRRDDGPLGARRRRADRHAGGTDRRRGARFTVAVTYHGRPGDGQCQPGACPSGGSAPTGGSYTIDEPDGAHPGSRPATTRRTRPRSPSTSPCRPAPSPWPTGASTRRRTTGGTDTWTWTADEPMATYLAVVAVGDYRFQDGHRSPRASHPPRLPGVDAATVAEPCLAHTTRHDRDIRGPVRAVPVRHLRPALSPTARRGWRWRPRPGRSSPPPTSTAAAPT